MEKLYWKIEKFSGSMINLMDEDQKIYSEKLTKKQLENFLCLKLRIARSYENPDVIASAMMLVGSNRMIDKRRSLRGTTTRCYIIDNKLNN
jgi:hypothetical protein